MTTGMPEPRYRIGEHVFHATTIEGKRSVDCPDCLGMGKWKVESPTGIKIDIPCPRCDGRCAISAFAWQPYTRLLTVGQVRMEWPKASWDSDRSVFQYMCGETGIGSGSIYDESKLFPLESDAEVCAKFLAADANGRIKDRSDQVKFDRINTYTLERALKGEEEDLRRKAEGDYEHLLGRIFELDTYPASPSLDDDGEETKEILSCCLDEDQVKVIQNFLVRFDEKARSRLVAYRKEG